MCLLALFHWAVRGCGEPLTPCACLPAVAGHLHMPLPVSRATASWGRPGAPPSSQPGQPRSWMGSHWDSHGVPRRNSSGTHYSGGKCSKHSLKVQVFGGRQCPAHPSWGPSARLGPSLLGLVEKPPSRWLTTLGIQQTLLPSCTRLGCWHLSGLPGPLICSVCPHSF